MEISVRLGGVPLLLSCAHNEYMLTYMPFSCCDMPLASVGVSAAEVELFMQFLFTRSTPLDVQRVCALEERLLQSVPVWQLVNRGDEASARLCHDTLAKEMYNA